jgi:hypothetical protein
MTMESSHGDTASAQRIVRESSHGDKARIRRIVREFSHGIQRVVILVSKGDGVVAHNSEQSDNGCV